MYEIPEFFTGKPDSVVDVMSSTIEKTYGFKAGTRKNLEQVKSFLGEYIKEITAALALLNDEDHSIVIGHLSDAKVLQEQAADEVNRQLGEHDKII